jgi:pseudaminic acid biosynthesis-associated methylase
MSQKTFKTEQEEFWAGTFGSEYVARNNSQELLASNLNFFSKVFDKIELPKSLIEFGANIGMNLKAIKLLYPNIHLKGIEINSSAAAQLKNEIGENNVLEDSIFNIELTESFDVSIIKGVLIHINPDMLDLVYEKLYQASHNYILIGEYYNPSPVTISFRGNQDRLFKRDFAGEILAKYKDLKLVNYGFVYKGDPSFPQDDITWFLLKKG